jgi:transposase InsO family protein
MCSAWLCGAVEVGAVLTDNCREFCGRPDAHPFELLLAMESIQHRTTKVRSPRTNGFVERMNRTLLDECFRGMAALSGT